MLVYAFGNARARMRDGGREGGEREKAQGRRIDCVLDKERNENGCGSSLACKMLRRRYHTARD